MVSLELSVADLLRCRFAMSPLNEVVEAGRAISAPFWTGLQGLIDALRASGKPLPRWFDIRPRFIPANALADLRATEAVAAAIAEFIHTSSRPVEEVDEWPLIMGGEQPSNQQPSCPTPPYRIDAYTRALTGAPPPNTLTASLSNTTLSFRTPTANR